MKFSSSVFALWSFHLAVCDIQPNQPQYTPQQLDQIARNKQISRILYEVDKEFKSRKTFPQSATLDRIPLLSRARKSYARLKSKWSNFQIGENQLKSPLPDYLKSLESAISSSDDVAVISVATAEYPTFNDVIEGIPVTMSEIAPGYYDYDGWDLSDKECEKGMLKKFIKQLCKELDDAQRQALADLMAAIDHINSGAVAGVNELVKCLGAIEEDLFDIFKEIVIIIDKLVEIGINGVQLVIEAIIEVFGDIIKVWEEQSCGCECPGFIHSILKYIFDLITWTPQKFLHQLITHIIDAILSLPFPRCTCACEGIFATVNKREFNYSNSTLHETLVSTEGFRKKSRGQVRNHQVKSPVLDKFDSLLQQKIEDKRVRQSERLQNKEPKERTTTRKKEPKERGSLHSKGPKENGPTRANHRDFGGRVDTNTRKQKTKIDQTKEPGLVYKQPERPQDIDQKFERVSNRPARPMNH